MDADILKFGGKKKAGHEFLNVFYYTVWCFPLQCSAGVFSGDALGELVGGYLHLQMAPLSIIHHVFEYFLCSSFFTLHLNVKSRRKRSPGSFCRPNLWETELLWHCVFQTSLSFNVFFFKIILGQFVIHNIHHHIIIKRDQCKCSCSNGFKSPMTQTDFNSKR